MVLQFGENPFEHFVVLPENLKDLQYINIVPGAIKGALAAVCDIYLR